MTDYSGRDEALAHLCFACAEMLSARTPGKSRRVADLAQLFASYVIENYIAAAAEKPDFHSGLPIWRLRKVETTCVSNSQRKFQSRRSQSWWN